MSLQQAVLRRLPCHRHRADRRWGGENRPIQVPLFQGGHMEKTDAVFARVAETFGIEYHNIDDVTE